jgi:hypothetical protein
MNRPVTTRGAISEYVQRRDAALLSMDKSLIEALAPNNAEVWEEAAQEFSSDVPPNDFRVEQEG